jgi:phospholipid transport system substrate-binding protein
VGLASASSVVTGFGSAHRAADPTDQTRPAGNAQASSGRAGVHRIILKCALIASILLVTPVASAEELSPDLLLKALTAEVTGIVKRNRSQLTMGRTSDVHEIVERKIVPLFDFSRMTQIALARNWALATTDQRRALTAEFKTLLVRTYATVLLNYRDQTFEFKPLTVEPRATQTTVKSVVKNGSTGLPIDYEMEKTAAGWKVYEIRFDGIRLIENYRSTFEARINDAGIDGLIKALSDKNRQSS